MALPRKLKNFNLLLDGESYAGVASEVVLPKLTRKTEEFRGGGMNGPVSADMGLEALSLEFTVGMDVRVYRQFGISKVDGALMRFVGAWQREDSDQVTAVEVVARGRYTELDPGTAKAGEAARKFISQVMITKLNEDAFSHVMDYKTGLQEELQKNGDVDIQYILLSEDGPAHAKQFDVEVRAFGKVMGQGQGPSKKAAEQKAAQNALESLKK